MRRERMCRKKKGRHLLGGTGAASAALDWGESKGAASQALHSTGSSVPSSGPRASTEDVLHFGVSRRSVAASSRPVHATPPAPADPPQRRRLRGLVVLEDELYFDWRAERQSRDAHGAAGVPAVVPEQVAEQ